jgi:hypothetical protein
MKLTKRELKVIEILVRQERCPDAYGRPIYAVAHAMGWTYEETVQFVWTLRNRDLVQSEHLTTADTSSDKTGWVWQTRFRSVRGKGNLGRYGGSRAVY